MVDISKIKPGDKITVEFTVAHINSCLVKTTDRQQIFLDRITSHTPAPRPIEVGCSILYKGIPCTVRAINGEYLWADNGLKGGWICLVSDCKRID